MSLYTWIYMKYIFNVNGEQLELTLVVSQFPLVERIFLQAICQIILSYFYTVPECKPRWRMHAAGSGWEVARRAACRGESITCISCYYVELILPAKYITLL
jgi:hypothetical protein